jgi:uncharacterized protein (DUF305 family)
MKAFTKTILAAALTVGLAGAAYAQATHGGHGTSSAAIAGMMPDMGPKDADTASTRDFKEADVRMMKIMDQPFTGDPDIDFRVHMIPHHQGAVDMAKVALKHAKDADTKKMAEAIIKDQEREVGEMQAWLKKHGK